MITVVAYGLNLFRCQSCQKMDSVLNIRLANIVAILDHTVEYLQLLLCFPVISLFQHQVCIAVQSLIGEVVGHLPEGCAVAVKYGYLPLVHRDGSVQESLNAVIDLLRPSVNMAIGLGVQRGRQAEGRYKNC